ncbi:substrate-binding protein [Marinitoga hydrogenitolerans DSM 16785]|uniref:Substrate-binding protein n=1 Tax=Marinitoga hydrogenitolerans (strain DSM 16785 / JCM 12826 / AT1271) TaxID=1122195 RepID=A0A1M4VBR2_MARH1|nr:ABC transporter substrate-binding protein [Marinitoga hydrogenitolerans]SHE66288.1 substrate-binding protein [Marinitoga hydrogenitolerans DSM 16785]
MNKKTFFISFMVVIIVTIYIINKPIKIGIIGNFSGDETFTTQDVVRSVNLFLSENKQVKLKIYYEDASGNPDSALVAYNNLKKKNIKIILFSTDSTSFKPIYPLLKKDKILGIGISISHDSYTNEDDWFIRVSLNNKNEQKKISDFLNKKTKKILVIKSYENSLYINNAFENFKKFYNGDINLITLDKITSSIKKIKSLYNGENYAYLLINSVNKTVLISNLLKRLNPEINIIVLSWFNDDEITNLFDNHNNIFSLTYFQQNPDFLKTFKKKYNKNPNIYAYLTYETLEILSQTFKNTKNNPKDIKNYILNNSFTTSFDTVEFDKYGEIKRTLRSE